MLLDLQSLYTLVVQGTINVTQGGHSVASSGKEVFRGTASVTQAGHTAQDIGQEVIVGTIAVTCRGHTISATGTSTVPVIPVVPTGTSEAAGGGGPSTSTMGVRGRDIRHPESWEIEEEEDLEVILTLCQFLEVQEESQEPEVLQEA